MQTLGPAIATQSRALAASPGDVVHRFFLSFCIALTALLFAGSAVAATPSSSLVRQVPKDTKLVVGVEVAKVKKSFLFNEMMTILRKQVSGKSILTFALDSGSFDFEKDIHSMLIAFERPMTNPQATSMPPSVLVMHGSFDPAKVKAAATRHFGKLKTSKQGKYEVHSASGLDLGFADANTLVIADQGSYSQRTWEALADEAKSAKTNEELGQMMKLVDTSRGVWIAMVTRGETTAPGAPPMDGAAMSLSLQSGVSADFLSQFEKPDDATQALAQFEGMKAQSANNPMVAMLGAQPLMDNLKAGVQDKRVLKMSTGMNDKQLRSMYTKLKAMAQQPPPMTETKTMAPNSGKEIAPPNAPTTKATGRGADADFN